MRWPCLLTGEGPVLPKATRPGRTIYSEAVRQALIVLWEAADRICGKRLKAILPGLIAAMEQHGHLALDPKVRQLLLAASPATIDRLLAPIRGTAGRRRKRRINTKSSREIPVRTFADWKEPAPGFLEVDFVAHGGDSMQGTFLWSLVATDVCSGWTEAVPLVAREQSLVVEGLEVIYKFNFDYDKQKFATTSNVRPVRHSPGAVSIHARADDFPRVLHPIVVIHKDLGRKVFNVSPAMAIGIKGMENEEGDALLREVIKYGVDERRAYYHTWRSDDMVLWDNWRVLHSATGGPADEERWLERTTIAGDYGYGRMESQASTGAAMPMMDGG